MKSMLKFAQKILISKKKKDIQMILYSNLLCNKNNRNFKNEKKRFVEIQKLAK